MPVNGNKTSKKPRRSGTGFRQTPRPQKSASTRDSNKHLFDQTGTNNYQAGDSRQDTSEWLNAEQSVSHSHPSLSKKPTSTIYHPYKSPPGKKTRSRHSSDYMNGDTITEKVVKTRGRPRKNVDNSSVESGAKYLLEDSSTSSESEVKKKRRPRKNIDRCSVETTTPQKDFPSFQQERKMSVKKRKESVFDKLDSPAKVMKQSFNEKRILSPREAAYVAKLDKRPEYPVSRTPVRKNKPRTPRKSNVSPKSASMKRNKFRSGQAATEADCSLIDQPVSFDTKVMQKFLLGINKTKVYQSGRTDSSVMSGTKHSPSPQKKKLLGQYVNSELPAKFDYASTSWESSKLERSPAYKKGINNDSRLSTKPASARKCAVNRNTSSPRPSSALPYKSSKKDYLHHVRSSKYPTAGCGQVSRNVATNNSNMSARDQYSESTDSSSDDFQNQKEFSELEEDRVPDVETSAIMKLVIESPQKYSTPKSSSKLLSLKQQHARATKRLKELEEARGQSTKERDNKIEKLKLSASESLMKHASELIKSVESHIDMEEKKVGSFEERPVYSRDNRDFSNSSCNSKHDRYGHHEFKKPLPVTDRHGKLKYVRSVSVNFDPQDVDAYDADYSRNFCSIM